MRPWLVSILVVAAVAVAGCGSAGTASGGKLQVVAAENFWGSIAAQLGGDRVRRDEHHHTTPTPTRTTTSRPPPTRARSPSARLVIVNGIGYDPWAPQAARRQPGARPHRADRRRPRRGSRTATTRTAGTRPANVQQVIDAITADYKRLDPSDAAYFDRSSDAASRRSGLAEYNRLIARDPAPSTRARRSARPRASSRRSPRRSASNLLTPHGLPQRDQRGHRARPPPTSAPSTARSAPGRSRCTSTTARTRRPTSSACRRGRARRASRSPPITETLTPAGATFQAVAVRAAARRSQAALRRRGAAMSVRARGPSSRTRELRLEPCARCWSDVERLRRPRASSSRSSARTAPASRRCSRRSSACCRWRGHRPRCWARPPARRNGEIGYLPQRRSFDAAARIRGVDVVRLGLDGDRWGVRCRCRSAQRASREADAASGCAR